MQQQHMANSNPYRGGDIVSYYSNFENMPSYNYMEKRRQFLRSYQFCRKRTFLQKVKLSLIRAKRLVLVKMRAAVKLKRLLWLRLRFGYPHRGRFHFHPLISANSSSRSAAATGRCWSATSCCCCCFSTGTYLSPVIPAFLPQ